MIEVFSVQSGHQHVGLHATLGVGLPGKLTIRRQFEFSVFEADVG